MVLFSLQPFLAPAWPVVIATGPDSRLEKQKCAQGIREDPVGP